MSRPCPCASKLTYERCCEPFLTGREIPDTVEKLMRSRFTAYALCRSGYLAATTAAEERAKLDLEELERYCKMVKCVSLKVLSAQGGPGDEAGTVVFHAKLLVNGKRMLHVEKSRFIRSSESPCMQRAASVSTQGRNPGDGDDLHVLEALGPECGRTDEGIIDEFNIMRLNAVSE